MIVKTEAIVLRTMRYRESSKIVTFYTRNYGKLAAVAKGARETKSKFGASLEPMTAVNLVLYKKEQRDLQFISQCDILKPHKKIHSEMERMAAALSVIELVYSLTQEGEEHPALFSLVDEMLDAVDEAAGGFSTFVLAFEIRLTAVLGFAPFFDKCVVCGKSGEFLEGMSSGVFQLDKGGMLCADCAAAVPASRLAHAEESVVTAMGRPSVYLRIGIATTHILQRLLTARMSSLAGLEYSTAVGNELDATLRSYLRYHLEGMRPLRSAEIFGKFVE